MTSGPPVRPMAKTLSDDEWVEIKIGTLLLSVSRQGRYIAEDTKGMRGLGYTPGQAIDDLRLTAA